jgi:hypothetical protein
MAVGMWHFEFDDEKRAVTWHSMTMPFGRWAITSLSLMTGVCNSNERLLCVGGQHAACELFLFWFWFSNFILILQFQSSSDFSRNEEICGNRRYFPVYTRSELSLEMVVIFHALLRCIWISLNGGFWNKVAALIEMSEPSAPESAHDSGITLGQADQAGTVTSQGMPFVKLSDSPMISWDLNLAPCPCLKWSTHNSFQFIFYSNIFDGPTFVCFTFYDLVPSHEPSRNSWTHLQWQQCKGYMVGVIGAFFWSISANINWLSWNGRNYPIDLESWIFAAIGTRKSCHRHHFATLVLEDLRVRNPQINDTLLMKLYHVVPHPGWLNWFR